MLPFPAFVSHPLHPQCIHFKLTNSTAGYPLFLLFSILPIAPFLLPSHAFITRPGCLEKRQDCFRPPYSLDMNQYFIGILDMRDMIAFLSMTPIEIHQATLASFSAASDNFYN